MDLQIAIDLEFMLNVQSDQTLNGLSALRYITPTWLKVRNKFLSKPTRNSFLNGCIIMNLIITG